MKEQITLSKEQIDIIKKTAIDFTRNTLGEMDSDHMCYTISYPLYIHLTNNDFNSSIKIGKVKDGKDKGRDHTWISMVDHYTNGFIIDATARQFNKELEYVDFYNKLCEEINLTSELAEKIYKRWSDDLIDHFKRLNSINELTQENPIKQSINTYMKISIKAALILINDNKPNSLNNKYLTTIYKGSIPFYGKEVPDLLPFGELGGFFQVCLSKIND